MNNQGLSYKTWETSILEKINHFHQEIFQISNVRNTLHEAIALAYGTLTDEQKIAFILEGEIPSLLRWQQQARHNRTGRCLFERDTGQLPGSLLAEFVSLNFKSNVLNIGPYPGSQRASSQIKDSFRAITPIGIEPIL